MDAVLQPAGSRTFVEHGFNAFPPLPDTELTLKGKTKTTALKDTWLGLRLPPLDAHWQGGHAGYLCRDTCHMSHPPPPLHPCSLLQNWQSAKCGLWWLLPFLKDHASADEDIDLVPQLPGDAEAFSSQQPLGSISAKEF